MNEWNKKILADLQENRTSYREMIDFCCDGLILNNYIHSTLENAGEYFEDFCGSTYDEEEDYYKDVYQEYIITSQDAERIAEYTNECVIYNENADIYLLQVTHFGTPWNGVPANWKTLEELAD